MHFYYFSSFLYSARKSHSGVFTLKSQDCIAYFSFVVEIHTFTLTIRDEDMITSSILIDGHSDSEGQELVVQSQQIRGCIGHECLEMKDTFVFGVGQVSLG
jgi:hypothetical protein